MTAKNNLERAANSLSLIKRTLFGAWIGLFVISFFIMSADEPYPWGKFWMIRPLLITTFAGAMGGVCNYFILRYHKLFHLPRAVAILLSIIVFLIGLWLGIILGLDGTMWN